MAKINESSTIAGVYHVQPAVHGDVRGLFVETFRREWIPGAREMIQANRADRRAGAIVGLHFHLHQADYWYVPFGRAYVALHDLRHSSPTSGSTLTLELDDNDHRGVYIPPGVAHGFYAITNMTITYLVDRYYDPADELGVAWNDPVLGIDWPASAPILSGRDRSNPRRADIPVELQPV